MTPRVIFLGGGVGPAAGLILHRLILKNTKALADQDHLKVLHMSFSDEIIDRSEALSAGRPDLPAEGMAKVLSAAYAACGAWDLPAVAGIACNTFHAPAIWTLFKERLREQGLFAPSAEGDGPRLLLLDMVEETVRFFSAHYPAGTKIGILSTSGTSREHLYSDPLTRAGFSVVEWEEQRRTHHIVYNREWGLKAFPGVTDQARSALMTEIQEMRKGGAEIVLLACTELPLVFDSGSMEGVTLLDPMEILARSLIRAADPGKLLTLSREDKK